MIKLKDILNEFKEDLKKQCVVLMGLPAAGKSTFINNEAQKYIPGFRGYTVSASDNQVLASQYQHGKNQYEWMLKNIKDEQDLKKFVSDSVYKDNDGKQVKIPITYNWWKDNKDKGIKHFYKTFYKSFYATYFDIRDAAQLQTKKMFDTKIKKSTNLLIIDTTAANSSEILKKLKKTKEADFNNTIIYLEIDPDLSIQRDKWRKEQQGRGVGESVILGYVNKLKNSYKEYQDNILVDRLMHFRWIPSGASPIKGNWALVEDNKYFLKRRIKK